MRAYGACEQCWAAEDDSRLCSRTTPPSPLWGPVGHQLAGTASGLVLLVMAGVSLFSGARASRLPYKLCSPVFVGSWFLCVLFVIVLQVAAA